jgi:hypothetical protein
VGKNNWSNNVEFIGNLADPASGGLAGTVRGSYTCPTDTYTGGTSEELSHDLDSVTVRSAGSIWRLLVFAIHDMGAERWIQLSAIGVETYDLVLHAKGPVPIDRFITSIEAWIADPTLTDRLIHVS